MLPRCVLVEDDGDRRIPCAAAGREIRPALYALAAVDRFGIEAEVSLVRLDIAEWFPRGGHLADLVLREPLHDPPAPAARPIWELWSAGPPAVKNLWAGHDRVEWLRAALAHRTGDGPDRPPGACYQVDGTHVADVTSFYCALGEAVNGPGGYFGRNLDALADCLRGGFGATAPFTVVGPEVPRVREVLEAAGVTLRAAP
ncbi:RNAse (barnase) inhibitor barstar [Amycolatopsis lexingtonensis]|uniref:RNAse (Barnase) inhibitor barstar n=1 Tax=Amycolatopsis lexingtonensis TaxID=218822 RepID=A0ABR9I4E0_9PSEU|nr:barstar family protein [Amycolatopsis lexingtonensis]MBE1498057.1 RNAse (barnase) inhibitor barstar [Amycolatopsis lexingtonensis]